MRTEHLSGSGPLYDGGDLVTRVRYRITVHTPTSVAEPKGRSYGRLRPEDGPTALPFFQQLRSEMLTLYLEDGRRWNCVMRTADGEVLGSGAIYRP